MKTAITIFGLSIGLLILLGILGGIRIRNQFKNRVKSDFIGNNAMSTELLTESDMQHLPDIVQKYLHYTKCVGRPKVKNFRAEIAGGMRSNIGDPYMKSTAVQYNFYQQPSRYFLMKAMKMGIPARAIHLYQNQSATFVVKLANWFKVVNAAGPEMNQGETVTFLNDMCVFAPATLIDKRLSWEELDSTSVRVTLTNASIIVSATLYFNSEGRLDNFISEDRFETVGKDYVNNPWATPVEGYKMINGYFLPGKGRLIYHRPDGDFLYGELEILDVVYNLERWRN